MILTFMKECRVSKIVNINLIQQNWSSEDYSWSDSLKSHLNQTFNIAAWRPLQQETINATMAGHDVLLIMPTGESHFIVIVRTISG